MPTPGACSGSMASRSKLTCRPAVPAVAPGTDPRLTGRYVDYLVSTLPHRLDGLTVVIAAANKLPPELATTEEAGRLYEHGCVTEMDIVQLIWRPHAPQGSSKDYQFHRAAMNARWQQGRADARKVLHEAPWLAPMPKELGVRVFG